MALLTWNSKHSVGVQAMDGEHMRMYDAINDLYAAVLECKQRSEIGPLLHNVVNCTRAHFSSEEAILEATKYPELAAHKLKHEFLLAEVEKLVARFDLGDLTLSGPSLNFLRYWMNAHIQNDDLCYGVWLNAHGVH